VSSAGRTIGVIELFSTEVRHIDHDLVRRLSALGEEIGPFIERRQLEEERLAIAERLAAMAQTLQQSLLPPSLPVVPGVDIAGRYHGASDGMDVGGDFYDVFRTGRGSWGLVLGDVCGKGAEAAAVTALVRYTMRAAAMQTRSPGRALSLLNRAMLEQQASDPAFDRFATAVHAVVRPGPESIAITVGCAGHLLPILRRRSGEVTTVGLPGTLLGVLPEISVVDTDVTLWPGDALVLYTDGVTEARSRGDEYGEERLVRLLERAEEHTAAGLAALIERDALAFQDGVARDDIAVVVILAH
jgi:sigma-B regulation protein RsbU (phosphoserine phosphatase)